MRILVVSWYFPPYNAIAAVRVGKFARFLREQGHDVRVLCGRRHDTEPCLTVPLAEEAIVRTGWLDVKAPPRALQSLRKRLLAWWRGRSLPASGTGAVSTAASGQPGSVDRLLHRLGEWYCDVINVPDAWVGWLPFALAGARRFKDWRPDVVFASGPPFTGFVIARLLARHYGVKWVAEFRDRWVDDPYFALWPDWRMRLITAIERRLLATSAGIVTVSEPWAELYRAKFDKPVVTAMNGFDPRDFPTDDRPEPLSDRLTIVYTGIIYEGHRDPAPLLNALRRLGPRRERVKVLFVGTSRRHVEPIMAEYGFGDVLEVLPPVPYAESLRLQRRADVLLLMQWNDPRDQGHTPAKLFEYLASRRPILGLGLEHGVPARMIRQRRAGLFSNDPAEIALQLEEWLAVKEREGRLPDLPDTVLDGLERDRQYALVEDFLKREVVAP